MRREALAGGLLWLAGACHATMARQDVAAAPIPDPALVFRRAFLNPGGMWLPQQMTLPRHVENFRKMGVRMDARVLADPLAAPLAAIVSLGGCSASFVSPEGLVATNHHCVQGALKFNSSKTESLIETGFLARTRAQERPAGPAQRLYVAQAFRDVTRAMRDAIERIADPTARKHEMESREKRLVAACEAGRPEVRCGVRGFYRGGTYTLVENLEIRDVRLVYVPHRSVGNYGGEIDNWAWPRHTGDFSLFRAYVGRDGKPADPSPDNVAYRPRFFLKVAAAGVRPGDFVMVAGYPGSTSRTDTALEIRHDVAFRLPYAIAHLRERYAIAQAHAGDGGETGQAAAVLKQGVQNGLEKNEGVQKGLAGGDLLARKEAQDRKVKAWAAQPGREVDRDAIDRLERILADEQRTARADYDRRAALGGSRLMSTAIDLTRWAEERAKPDAQRKPGYQERDLRRAIAGARQFAKSYDRTLDRALFRLALVRALRLPEADRPWLPALLDAGRGQAIDEQLIDRTLDAWYAAPQIEDEKLRLDLLREGTTARVRDHGDPFLRAAQRIWPVYKAEERKSDARTGEMIVVAPSYAAALREVEGGWLAPDANGTLRITYGTVRSFRPESRSPADAPFTVAAQIPVKDTGKDPFDMPPRVLDAIRAGRYGPYADAGLGGELPVNFLSDLDITGGNSGSATLDGNGDLVGLAFDGTLMGVSSDVVFDGATTRTIHVDARYMLWTMDLVDGADHLLLEMGVRPALEPPPAGAGATAAGAR